MKYIKHIKKMPYIHCARGPERCEKCKKFAEKEDSYALIKVFLESTNTNIARPIIEIYIGCRKIIGEYDIIKRFNDIEDAKIYAKNNKIDITF